MNTTRVLVLAALAVALLSGCTGYPAHMGWGGHHGGAMRNGWHGADGWRQAPQQPPCPDEQQRDRQAERWQDCEPAP